MSAKLSWIFGSATVLAYGFVFGIGANDVANRCHTVPFDPLPLSLPLVIYISISAL